MSIGRRGDRNQPQLGAARHFRHRDQKSRRNPQRRIRQKVFNDVSADDAADNAADNAAVDADAAVDAEASCRSRIPFPSTDAVVGTVVVRAVAVIVVAPAVPVAVIVEAPTVPVAVSQRSFFGVETFSNSTPQNGRGQR